MLARRGCDAATLQEARGVIARSATGRTMASAGKLLIEPLTPRERTARSRQVREPLVGPLNERVGCRCGHGRSHRSRTSTRVALLDWHWTSGSGAGAPDRYDLSISAGAVQVTLDEHAAAGRPNR